jgi:hypothetical protein
MTTDKQRTEEAKPVYSGQNQADVHANPDREDITPAMATRCILTAVVTLILLFGVGYFIHDRYYLSDGFFVRKYENDRRYDVVFVGDSRVIRGIDPKQVESASPSIRAYNFGFSGLGIDLEVLEHAKNLINKNSPVRTIAIAVSRPSLSAANATENGYLAVEEMTRIERANLSAFGRIEGFFRMRPTHVVPIKTDPSGFVFTKANKPSEAVTKRDAKGAEDKANWVSDAQIAKLADWIRKTRQEGYNVAVFRVPTSRQMYEVESGKLALDVPSIRRAVEAVGARWLDTPPYREDLLSYDGSHLAGKSAEEFTRELAAEMGPLLESKHSDRVAKNPNHP